MKWQSKYNEFFTTQGMTNRLLEKWDRSKDINDLVEDIIPRSQMKLPLQL